MVSDLDIADPGLVLANSDAPVAVETHIKPYTLVSLRSSALHPSTASSAVCAYSLEVDSSSNDFNIGKRELRALRKDDAVQCNHTGAIVVEAIAIAALLIRVEVNATELARLAISSLNLGVYLHRSLPDQLDAAIELSKLVVARRRVGEDFDTVQTHEDVRADGELDLPLP